MVKSATETSSKGGKRRVLKSPAVRRTELVDAAQRLFVQKGYEATTVNDVIVATGLSKGAFYHYFRSKDDLLEAIAAKFSENSLVHVASIQNEESLDALQRLNALLALGRQWKLDHVAELRALFALILEPENALLYQRIAQAVFEIMTPALTAIVEQGAREGIFDVPDAHTVAEALLWLGNGRQSLVARVIATLDDGGLDQAAKTIYARLKSEEVICDRILGLPAGSVEFIDGVTYIRKFLLAWSADSK